MKICLIHNSWETSARRGAEQLILTLSAGLRAQGHEVFVVTTKPWGASDPATPRSEKVYYIPSAYSYLGHWPVFLRLLWHMATLYNFLAYARIKRIVSHEKPDIIWTHNLVGLGFLPLRLGHRYRHFHTIHDIQLLHPSGLLMYGHEAMIHSLPARIYQFLVNALFSASSVIISPSRWLLELHRKASFFKSNRCEVIANPLSAANFPQRNSEEEPSVALRADKSFTFFYVGQIEGHKGVPLLLEAFSHLKDSDVRLRIVGDGKLLTAMQATYASPRIEFLGRQGSERVRAEMEAAQCLVVPSLCYENQPTVILEAFASDLPVIGSAIGGVQELLQYKELLFRPIVSELADKMKEVVNEFERVHSLSRQAARTIHSSLIADYIRRLLS